MLREGAIPLEMIMLSLTGSEVTKDYETNWRFYENGVFKGYGVEEVAEDLASADARSKL